ncbi:MAG: hypothetical protein M1827_000499 [Pycnora praestabilis]|nr:MAG: hypothetical protein M1827_000499 [Pycnora praestabilis]
MVEQELGEDKDKDLSTDITGAVREPEQKQEVVEGPYPAPLREGEGPDRDPERGHSLATSKPLTAVLPSSLPNHSQHSLHSQTGQSYTSAEAEDPSPEYAWGPSHPCFPHINPHVPLTSPLYTSTRIIRIRRDWMIAGDLAPTFSNLYPEILDPLMSEEQFRTIIVRLNGDLIQAFDPWGWWNWVDGVMGLLTFWLWDDFGFTSVKRRLKHVEAWLEEWNRTVGEREGVAIIPLRRTAYMSLDIQIPDPHVGVDPPETISRPQTQHSAGALPTFVPSAGPDGDSSVPNRDPNAKWQQPTFHSTSDQGR